MDVRQGPKAVADCRGRAGQLLAALADEHRDLGGRLYWENREENLLSAAAQKTDEIKIPVAITVFPEDDLFRAPETWARRAFPSLIYFRQAERGGHFAAWEQPELFAAELRAAFTFLR